MSLTAGAMRRGRYDRLAQGHSVYYQVEEAPNRQASQGHIYSKKHIHIDRALSLAPFGSSIGLMGKHQLTYQYLEKTESSLVMISTIAGRPEAITSFARFRAGATS